MFLARHWHRYNINETRQIVMTVGIGLEPGAVTLWNAVARDCSVAELASWKMKGKMNGRIGFISQPTR